MIQDIKIQGRSLRLIARDIEVEWNGTPPFELRPALVAMRGVASIKDWYGAIPMVSIVRTVIALADQNLGLVSTDLLAELRAMIDD